MLASTLTLGALAWVGLPEVCGKFTILDLPSGASRTSASDLCAAHQTQSCAAWQLAAIYNESDLNEVKNLTESLSAVSVSNSFWLSGYYYPGGWVWAQNGVLTPMEFEDWAPGQPDTSNRKNCMAMTMDAYDTSNDEAGEGTGSWSTRNCQKLLYAAICQCTADEDPNPESQTYFETDSTWLQSCRDGQSQVGSTDLPNTYTLEFQFNMTNKAYGEVQLGRWYTASGTQSQDLVPYVHIHYSGSFYVYFSRNWPQFNFYAYYTSSLPFTYNQVYDAKIEISDVSVQNYLDGVLVSSYDWVNQSCYIKDDCVGNFCFCNVNGKYQEANLTDVPVFVGQDFSADACFDFYVRNIKVYG